MQQTWQFKGIKTEIETTPPELGCLEMVNLVNDGGYLRPRLENKVAYNVGDSTEKIVYTHICDTVTNTIVITKGKITFANPNTSGTFSMSINAVPSKIVVSHIKYLIIFSSIDAEQIFYSLFDITTGLYSDCFELPSSVNVDFYSKSKIADRRSLPLQLVKGTVSDLNMTFPSTWFLDSTKDFSQLGIQQGDIVKREYASATVLTFNSTRINHTELPPFTWWSQGNKYAILKNSTRDEDIKIISEINSNTLGYVLCRAAYKLFDGSIIGVSKPVLISVGEYETIKDADNFPETISLIPGDIYCKNNSQNINQKVISSIVVYITKPFDLFEPDSFTPKKISLDYINNSIFYQATEISITNTNEVKIELDKSKLIFNPTLLLEHNANNTIFYDQVLNFNGRLFSGVIKTKLFDKFAENYNIKYVTDAEAEDYLATGDYCVVVQLDTFEGSKTIISDLTTLENKLIYTNLLVSYPDKRAKKILICKKTESGYVSKATYNLTPHATEDYSFFFINYIMVNDGIVNHPVNISNEEFFKSQNTQFNNLVQIPEADVLTYQFTNNYTITDVNRLIASKVNNPFVFPFKNSYQVGSGRILDIAVQSREMSQGQFGLFPLTVFSESGIYSLQVGSSDVLIEAIAEISNQRINSNTASDNDGIFFTTLNGLFVINGSQIKQIGEGTVSFERNNLIPVWNEANFRVFYGDDRTVNLIDNLLKQSTQITNTVNVVAYDKTHSIIYLNDLKIDINSGYAYKGDNSITWAKQLNGELVGFINGDYTKLVYLSQYYGQLSTNGKSNTDCAIITAPIYLNKFVNIERIFLHCKIKTTKVVGLYVWGSNDGINWHFITGNQRTGDFTDLVIPRFSMSLKYILIGFSGNISYDSYIKNLDVEITDSNFQTI